MPTIRATEQIWPQKENFMPTGIRIYCAVDFYELVGRRALKISPCFLIFLRTACPVHISFPSWILLTNVFGILTEASIGGLEAPIGPP